MHRVVVPFPCSWNGVTAVDLAIGDVRDFGTMADGLVGMGWIEPVEAAADVAAADEFAVEEPAAIEMSVVDTVPIEMAVVKRGRKRK